MAWGGFWYPLRWFDELGVGSAWISEIFFIVMAASALPWVFRRNAWGDSISGQLLTGLLLGLAFALYMISLVMTDVIHAILLFYLTPVWSTIGGIIFLRERLTISRSLAMILGFAGMAFILGVKDGLPLPRNSGDWIALASGICWAFGTLRSYTKPTPGIAVHVFVYALGGLVASAAILGIAGLQGSPLASTGQMFAVLPLIVGLAFIIFVPPSFLVLWAAQRIDPGRVGILLMTEVLAGAITAALFSGEQFGVVEFAGTTLIICAGLIEVLGRR